METSNTARFFTLNCAPEDAEAYGLQAWQEEKDYRGTYESDAAFARTYIVGHGQVGQVSPVDQWEALKQDGAHCKIDQNGIRHYFCPYPA